MTAPFRARPRGVGPGTPAIEPPDIMLPLSIPMACIRASDLASMGREGVPMKPKYSFSTPDSPPPAFFLPPSPPVFPGLLQELQATSAEGMSDVWSEGPRKRCLSCSFSSNDEAYSIGVPPANRKRSRHHSWSGRSGYSPSQSTSTESSSTSSPSGLSNDVDDGDAAPTVYSLLAQDTGVPTELMIATKSMNINYMKSNR